MFYVKEPITDNMEFQMEITDKNVFCRCPVCGKEVPVNLEKVLAKVKGACSRQPSYVKTVPGN
ncbi:hypothetical protein [Acidaminococcus massiliensis]|uniref:hypothetical protein n=1 Tax=Acidaminococcus massiliensis TaxID=1852375 RepID=UPI0022E42798|nr:hypothetical protein [Acidaminococcus massiliensis]